jgi:hypothetical protein
VQKGSDYKMKRFVVLFFAAILCSPALWAQDSVEKLASDFWAWRVQYQPFNNDDIPRVERPHGQKRSWSAESVTRQREVLATFETRWNHLDAEKRPTAQQVDYRLIGSALSRVRWELDFNRRWQRDPTFYLEQTITPVLTVLLPPAPISQARSHDLIVCLENVPSILEEGKANLQEPVGPFAKLAIDSLVPIRAELQVVAGGVAPLLSGADREELAPAIERATVALESFRAWLEQRLPQMTQQVTAGREAYVYFLKNVALYPFTPEQLLEMSHQEWARAVVSETFEHQRNKGVAELKKFATVEEQIEKTSQMEASIRSLLTSEGILTVPSKFPHYTARLAPDYLAALGDFGELDDFTGPSRLDQNCVRWTPKPSGELGYFADATARDTRPIIVHEGVPGHYMQLWLSWNNPDPIRRHYYDSGANEGIGFYAEEMMLRAGLFDDSPRSREIIFNFMRLRALRVEVDVKLALGEFTVEQGANYLAQMVPMDSRTALTEAAFFATQPGLAIAYETGKLQITDFLAEDRRRSGDKFDLKAIQDFIWSNGNVPIALLRMEWFAAHPSGN